MTAPPLTLAVIAKHGAEGFKHLVDAARPHVSQILVALDDNAEPGIDGYCPDSVTYYHRSLNRDFSAQRNFLIEHATNPWVIHLDTDETLSPWLWAGLEYILPVLQAEVILLPRINNFVNGPTRLNWPDWQPKLTRSHVRFIRPVHEWPAGHYNGMQFPCEDRYAILHTKTAHAQELANNFYATIPGHAECAATQRIR